MSLNKIDKLIDQNDSENINLYFSKVVSKSKDLSQEINKITLLMIITVFTKYLIDIAALESINLGYLSVKNIESFAVFLPLILGLLIFRFIIIRTHSIEVNNIIRRIGIKHFNYQVSPNEHPIIDDFSRSVIPVSFYDEINKFNFKKGCLINLTNSLIFGIAVLSLALLPLIIEFIWVIELYRNFGSLNIVPKLSVIFTTWFLFVSIIYFLNTIILNGNHIEAKAK